MRKLNNLLLILLMLASIVKQPNIFINPQTKYSSIKNSPLLEIKIKRLNYVHKNIEKIDGDVLWKKL